MKKFLNKYLPLLYGKYFNVLAFFSPKTAAKKAFTLFCTPRKGRLLPSQVPYLKEAEHSLEEVSGHQLQTYRWAGEKETVLLLHGWESNSFRWRNLIGFLQREGYEIVSFDAPAHGKSSGKIFNVPLYTACTEYMVHLHRPKFLIAHSVGGMAALYNQYKNQGKNSIEKVITIGSPAGLPELMEFYEKTLRYNKTVVSAIDNYVFQSFGFRVNDFSIPEYVKEIKTKGLLIHDELDSVAPMSASERVHENWKNSQFIKTKGLGHSLHQDEVNQLIVDFLDS